MRNIRILLFFFTLSFLGGCATLKLAYTDNNDGKRTVMSSNISLFSAKSYNFDIAMGARVSEKDTIMAVLITCDKDSDHGIFNKGNRLMIKLEGGEIISLSNVYEKEFEEKSQVVNTTDRVNSYGYEYFYSPYDDAVYLSPYEVTTFVPRTYVRRTHNSYALYLISKKQINDICQKGVIKLRVEIEDKDIDMPYPEHAPAIFSELYTFISPIITNGIARSEF